MSDRPTLSTLARRLQGPLLAGLVAGLVSGCLVIAALIWRDGLPMSRDAGPDARDVAISETLMGRVGRYKGPDGTTITMGLGRRPGIADPADDRWFWQRVEGLGPDACRTTALDLLDQADFGFPPDRPGGHPLGNSHSNRLRGS